MLECVVAVIGVASVVVLAVPDAWALTGAGQVQQAIVLDGYWNPYLIGIGLGLVTCLAFVLSDHTIGVSSSFARTSGMIERLLGVDVEKKRFYREKEPRIDWQWIFVAGLLLGSFLSAVLFGDFRLEAVPPLWSSMVGESVLVRWLVAFDGGLLVSLGARWAGGCTSGHGISGGVQLMVSSWLAVLCFFVGGILSAALIY